MPVGWAGTGMRRRNRRTIWIALNEPARCGGSHTAPPSPGRGSDREAVHFGHRGTPPRFSAIERHAARRLFTKDVFRRESEFRNAPSRPPRGHERGCSETYAKRKVARFQLTANTSKMLGLKLEISA